MLQLPLQTFATRRDLERVMESAHTSLTQRQRKAGAKNGAGRRD
jgi:hypothetical protein